LLVEETTSMNISKVLSYICWFFRSVEDISMSYLG